MTREVSLLLGASAVMHLLVDGICLCCLYLTVASPNAENILAVFLLYNVLAFLGQPLTGLIADRLTHRHWLLLLSVGFLALGVCSWCAGVVVASAVAVVADAGCRPLGHW